MTVHKSTHSGRRITIGHKREDWLSTVFENMSEMAGILDQEGRVLDVNRAALERIHEKKENITGRYFWDTGWWSHNISEVDQVKEAIRRAHLGESTSFETVAEGRNGRKRHVNFSCEPLFDYQGEVRYILALGADITEVKALDRIIEEQNRSFRLLFEKSVDANLLIHEDEIIDCNDAAISLFRGKNRNQILGKNFLDLSPMWQSTEETTDTAIRRIHKELEETGGIRFEWVHRDCMGHEFFADIVFTRITMEGHSYVHASIRDISQRKRIEEELRRVSFFDRLTGLYNRHYFEEELERIQAVRARNIGVVILDVNGLKITNDTMGHGAGDILLKAAAESIRDAVRAGDFVARIGGDEFAMILENTTEEVIHEIENKLNENIETFNLAQDALVLSIAYGHSIVRDPKNIVNGIRKADDEMYTQKTEKRQQFRCDMIKAWTRSLISRGIHNEVRLERLENYMRGFAGYLGIEPLHIENLVQLARYHDVGLVAVDPKFVLKSGSLDEREYAAVKKHAESGARLAAECEELKAIAEWIEKHHERWDGNGYPGNCAGENIPLECRILALVDSFESMTIDLVYREAMHVEEALEEIRSEAGKQFDPVLADRFVDYIKDIPEFVYGDITD